jgi:hypothetical protein
LWLAYVIVEGDEPLIQQAIPVFEEECSMTALQICKISIRIGSVIHPFLRLGRKIYRQLNLLKDRMESKAGKKIGQGESNH